MKAIRSIPAWALLAALGLAGCGGEAGRNPALRLKQVREVFVPMEQADVMALSASAGPRGASQASDNVKPHFTYGSARFGREDSMGIIAFTSETLLGKGAQYQVMGVADLYHSVVSDTVGSGLIVNPGAAGSFVATRDEVRRAIPLLPKGEPVRRRLATME